MLKTRQKRERWVGTALGLMLILVLTGCGSVQSATGPMSEGPAQEPTQPHYGGTLKVALHGEIDKLDPHQSVTIVAFQVQQNVVESLVTINDNLDGVEPQLATDWTVSDDGLTYTFHLRKGVKFHNGKDFKAEDVIYSYNRIMDPNFPSSRRSNFTMVKSVESPDDYTVVFHLEYPFAAFLTKLESLYILPKDAGVDFNQQLIGSGPFQFVEWVSGDRIVLKRFDQYWEIGKPYLDQVIFKPIPEDSTKLVELKTGNIQLIGNVPYKDVSALEKDEKLKVYRKLGVVRDHFGFNVTQPPFDNKYVRQAMCWLVDREGIADAILYGYAKPAQVALPESHWAFNPAVANAYGFDVEKARELLAKGGYPNGFSATIKVSPTYPEEIKMAELIAEAGKKIGVNLNIQQLEWSTWIDQVVSKGDYQAEIVLISGGVDPDDFFYQWHHSGEIFNIWRFSTPELDQLLDAGRQTLGGNDARKPIYYDIQSYLIDQAPLCHIIYRESVMASTANVHGFTMTGREDMRFKDVWLQP